LPLNEEIIKLYNRYKKIVMLGAMSVTEIVKATEAVADNVKIFPVTLLGPKIIKALKSPLSQVSLLSISEVNVDNVAEWIKAGSFAVSVSISLKAGAKRGDYKEVAETAKEFIQIIKATREKIEK